MKGFERKMTGYLIIIGMLSYFKECNKIFTPLSNLKISNNFYLIGERFKAFKIRQNK